METKLAPYLELEDYRAPKGINPIFMHMEDNIKIRIIYWKNIYLSIQHL